MASRVFLVALAALANKELDLGADDIRVALLMSSNDAATKALTAGAANLDDLTLDECDATDYARVALDTPSVAIDDANNRIEFDDSGAAAAVFEDLGGDGTRDYSGALLYKHVDGTAANDIPIAWIEFASAVVKEATEVTVTWNPEGIIQFANA